MSEGKEVKEGDGMDLVKEARQTTTKDKTQEDREMEEGNVVNNEKERPNTSNLTLEEVAYLLDMDGEGGLCFQQMLSNR